jgi:hypothetical protein
VVVSGGVKADLSSGAGWTEQVAVVAPDSRLRLLPISVDVDFESVGGLG